MNVRPTPTRLPALTLVLALLAGPLVGSLAAFPAHATESFSGVMSGSWVVPERRGEGQFIGFQEAGDRHFVIVAWFTYDNEGRPQWLVGNVDYTPGATEIRVPMITGRGARFGSAFDRDDVVLDDAGHVDLAFIDCNRIGFAYDGADQQLGFELERLVGPLSGIDCENPQPTVLSNGLSGIHSGAWYDPARAGEGQFFALEQRQDRTVAIVYYFTYDDEGRPDWRVGSVDIDPSAETDRIRIPLVSGAGARFGSAFDPDDVVLSPSGAVMLDPTGCDAFRLRLHAEQTFGLNLQRLGGGLADLPCPIDPAEPDARDQELAGLIDDFDLTGDPSAGRTLPGIDAPLAQLGRSLFFSKRLGAELDAACASCHHPSLGGADGLALSIGTGAEDPDVLGPGRRRPDGEIRMHRNTPTFFNTGLFDRGLFWDSRVESLSGEPGANGSVGGIRTPATALGQADPDAGPNLLAAQARFPVGAPDEMRGDALPGQPLDEVHAWLAGRLGDHGAGQGLLPPGRWLERFQEAFDSDAPAEDLITFENIALALGEYQRSAVFVETPWSQYVRGDLEAIDDQAKRGALLFLNDTDQGGMGCARCHSGDLFTDLEHRRVGFPQVGPGFGDGDGSDFGRIRETGVDTDLHAFRTPSLLNIARTAPYGHSGMYASLGNIMGHYFNPDGTVFSQMFNRSWCSIAPFDTQPDCGQDFDVALANSRASLADMTFDRENRPELSMPPMPLDVTSQADFDAVVAFLESLTDPCLLDRACYGRWTPAPDDAPDEQQLNAVDGNGNPL